MTGPAAAILPGHRLHLQHGPIDLVIGADGDRDTAFRAAAARFEGVLEALVAELPLLRSAVGPEPEGPVARRMHRACMAHRGVFVTPMAAVAGSVADEVLAAMTAAAELTRAYVNNGGDIALHLARGQSFRLGVAGLDGSGLGQAVIRAEDPVRGVATSGQGGRSLSLGIATSVTVLARTAAEADVAATLIANAVDLPGHPAVTRIAAREIDSDSDLGNRPVVTGVADLLSKDIDTALARGHAVAEDMRRAGLIHAAALFLQERAAIAGPIGTDTPERRSLCDA